MIKQVTVPKNKKMTPEGLLAALVIRRRGSYKINAAGSKAACHFLFTLPLKAKLSLASQTKNAAKGGSIYLVTPEGFKPPTFRTGI